MAGRLSANPDHVLRGTATTGYGVTLLTLSTKDRCASTRGALAFLGPVAISLPEECGRILGVSIVPTLHVGN